MTKEEHERLYIRERIEGLSADPLVEFRSLDFCLALKFMANGGTSVLLNWGEDDGLWECSWITGGKRFTAHSTDMYLAVRDVLLKVEEAVRSATNH